MLTCIGCAAQVPFSAPNCASAPNCSKDIDFLRPRAPRRLSGASPSRIKFRRLEKSMSGAKKRRSGAKIKNPAPYKVVPAPKFQKQSSRRLKNPAPVLGAARPLGGVARSGTLPTWPDTVRHGPAWRDLAWLIEVRGLAKCIVGANESRPLPPALPKHRTLIGIMRSPSKNNNRRRSYPIGRHLFCPSCSQHGPIVASRCPRWNLGGANMVSRWPT